VRVLAIDGGGIRGIIPARVLVELERLGGRPVSDMFDLIAGTSTGGILALGLTVPGQDGSPRYAARDLLSLYTDRGGEIFPGGGVPTWRTRLLGPSGGKNIGQDVWGSAQRIGALFGGNPKFAANARYFPGPLEAILKEFLGDTPFGWASKPVIVPTYDMRASKPLVFRSVDFAGQPQPLMREVARATSAGPTYFPPARMTLGGVERVLVDGGLAANNPAMFGYTAALASASPKEILMLSLGTGTKDEADPKDVTYDAIRTRSWPRVGAGVFSAVMDGSSEAQDQMLAGLLSADDRRRYWRLQASLGSCNFAMDAADTNNVACLTAVAEGLVRQHAAELEAVAAAANRGG
jgi:patatin-like phospholipase/acyl hydrolase